MELTLAEIQKLEELLRKAHNINDYPYHGKTSQVWIGDKIDRFEEYNQRKIDRREK